MSVAAAFADIDNDGDNDLFVTTTRGGNVLFQNDGLGRFVDVAKDFRVDYSGHSSAPIFFDYNNDGFLDLFVSNIGKFTMDKVSSDGHYLGHKDAFAGHLKSSRNEASILYKNVVHTTTIVISRHMQTAYV